MVDTIYDVLYITEIIISLAFQIGILYLIHRYIEVRKIKQ